MPEPRRDTLLTSQPGKTIWTIFTVLFGAARLPIWMLYFIPVSTRPHANWSWQQAVRMRFLDAFLRWSTAVEAKTPMTLEAGNEKDQWALMNPAKDSYYTGVTTLDPAIKPTKIGGTWYPSKPNKINPNAYVVLHFHGGAFVVGDGRKQDTAFLAHTILKHADVPYVFCPQYRLASNPGGRFPATLQDAITSYSYLINDMGISPNQIIVGGDSAGGNLTMSFLRYLADHGKQLNLPGPKCAWLWSPWVNPMEGIHNPGSVSRSPLRSTDFLNDAFTAWGAECYAPDSSSAISINSEYICFIGTAFKTETPCWVTVGDAEVLFHDDVKFYEQFKAISGNKFELSIQEHAPHDIILVGALAGFEKKAEAEAKKAGKYLRSL